MTDIKRIFSALRGAVATARHAGCGGCWGNAVKRWFAILLCLMVAACSGLAERHSLAPELTGAAGWRFETLEGGAFAMAAAVAPLRASPTLVVYLEGDGFAYVDRARPASDPTPLEPTALRLALAHPDDGVNRAWLGRPCQYVMSPACRTAYWTDRRYAPEIVDGISAAIASATEEQSAVVRDISAHMQVTADAIATISGNMAGIAHATEDAAQSTGKVKALSRTLAA